MNVSKSKKQQSLIFGGESVVRKWIQMHSACKMVGKWSLNVSAKMSDVLFVRFLPLLNDD